MRTARADAERRRSALAVDIVVALTERDVAIERHERAAADAVAKLIGGEGFTVAEAGAWADGLSVAEVKRPRETC